MNQQSFLTTRIYATGVVAIAMGILLAWNHFHGGVPSHHILAREDLPSFSNWWGVLTLPLLTWWLLYRTQRRISREASFPTGQLFPRPVWYRFFGGLLFGALLSLFFTLGNEDMPFYMLMSLFPLALFFPIYRSECLLGFVFGMVFTFGGILPIGIGTIFTIFVAAVYLLLRPALLFVYANIRG